LNSDKLLYWSVNFHYIPTYAELTQASDIAREVTHNGCLVRLKSRKLLSSSRADA